MAVQTTATKALNSMVRESEKRCRKNSAENKMPSPQTNDELSTATAIWKMSTRPVNKKAAGTMYSDYLNREQDDFISGTGEFNKSTNEKNDGARPFDTLQATGKPIQKGKAERILKTGHKKHKGNVAFMQQVRPLQ